MRRPTFHFSSRRRRPAAGDSLAPILAFVGSLAAGLIVMLVLLPAPMVLPAFSLWALAAAAAAALMACLRPRAEGARRVTAWDVVGAFALISCAAAILGEIEHMIEYLRPVSPRSQAHD